MNWQGVSYIFDTKPIHLPILEDFFSPASDQDNRNSRILVEDDEVDFLTTWFTSAQVLTSGFFPRLKTLDLICTTSYLSVLGISQLFNHLMPPRLQDDDVARILDRITITTPYIPSHMRSMHGQEIPGVCRMLHLVGLDGASCSCSAVDILHQVPDLIMDMYRAEMRRVVPDPSPNPQH